LTKFYKETIVMKSLSKFWRREAKCSDKCYEFSKTERNAIQWLWIEF